MTEPTEHTEQSEDRPVNLPENPRENPADTVDALEEKVSGEVPDRAEENPADPEGDGADPVLPDIELEDLPGAGGPGTGAAEPPA